MICGGMSNRKLADGGRGCDYISWGRFCRPNEKPRLSSLLCPRQKSRARTHDLPRARTTLRVGRASPLVLRSHSSPRKLVAHPGAGCTTRLWQFLDAWVENPPYMLTPRFFRGAWRWPSWDAVQPSPRPSALTLPPGPSATLLSCTRVHLLNHRGCQCLSDALLPGRIDFGDDSLVRAQPDAVADGIADSPVVGAQDDLAGHVHVARDH